MPMPIIENTMVMHTIPVLMALFSFRNPPIISLAVVPVSLISLISLLSLFSSFLIFSMSFLYFSPDMTYNSYQYPAYTWVVGLLALLEVAASLRAFTFSFCYAHEIIIQYLPVIDHPLANMDDCTAFIRYLSNSGNT